MVLKRAQAQLRSKDDKKEVYIIKVNMSKKGVDNLINVLERGILTHTHTNQIIARGHKKDKSNAEGVRVRQIIR